jgi:hypothetical protein
MEPQNSRATSQVPRFRGNAADPSDTARSRSRSRRRKEADREERRTRLAVSPSPGCLSLPAVRRGRHAARLFVRERPNRKETDLRLCAQEWRFLLCIFRKAGGSLSCSRHPHSVICDWLGGSKMTNSGRLAAADWVLAAMRARNRTLGIPAFLGVAPGQIICGG